MGRAEDLFSRLEAEGEPFIEELIANRKSEEYFLDFKRSSNGGSSSRLSDNDRNSLARALSGFANSEGGVLVWGVECSRDPQVGDVAQSKFPLENPQRFASLVEGAVSGLTVPGVQGCRSISISSANGGFVATLIPGSAHAPHQLTQEKRYLIRVGSNFEPVPHAVLAGMFGRRPQPTVFPNFTLAALEWHSKGGIEIRCGVMLVNNGNVVAEDCFVSLFAYQIGGPAASFKFGPGDDRAFQHTFATGRDISVMSKREFRLAPGGFVNALNFHWTMPEAPCEGLHLKLTAGCGGAPPYEQVFKVEKGVLILLYQEAHSRFQDPAARSQVDWRHSHATKMLGLPVPAHWTA